MNAENTAADRERILANLRDLLARVLACEGYDRELDADVVVALEGGEIGWRQANFTMEQHPYIRRPSGMHVGGFAREPVPAVTFSVDAALGLAMRTLSPQNIVVNLSGQPRCTVVLRPSVDACHSAEGQLDAAVAIVAATLKAHIARHETG